VAVAYAEAEAEAQYHPAASPMARRPNGFYYHVQTYDNPAYPASTAPLAATPAVTTAEDGTEQVVLSNPGLYNGAYNPYYGYNGLNYNRQHARLYNGGYNYGRYPGAYAGGAYGARAYGAYPYGNGAYGAYGNGAYGYGNGAYGYGNGAYGAYGAGAYGARAYGAWPQTGYNNMYAPQVAAPATTA
jgi:hypothetical protein